MSKLFLFYLILPYLIFFRMDLLAAAQPNITTVPNWVTHPPIEDSNYRFYLGSSNGTQNTNESFDLAYQNALGEAIRENFGVETKIDNDHYDTLSETSAVKKFSESTNRIHVVGFEKVDLYINNDNAVPIVFALYRYRKTEIEKEKLRLLNKNALPIQPNLLEGRQHETKALIESNPTRARIYIDDVDYGVTPLRIQGILGPGQHKVRIDHPNFELLEKSMLLLDNAVEANLTFTLIPAFGKLTIEGAPAGSAIKIDGKLTTLAEIKVSAGMPHTVSIDHKDYFELVTKDIVVCRNCIQSVSGYLMPRPATVKFKASESNAAVYLDDNLLGKSGSTKILPAGNYNFIFKKDGFKNCTASALLSPNEKLEVVCVLEKIQPKVDNVPMPLPEQESQSKNDYFEFQTPQSYLSIYLFKFGALNSPIEKLPGVVGSFTFAKSILADSDWNLVPSFSYSALQKALNGDVLTFVELSIGAAPTYTRRISMQNYISFGLPLNISSNVIKIAQASNPHGPSYTFCTGSAGAEVSLLHRTDTDKVIGIALGRRSILEATPLRFVPQVSLNIELGF